MEFIETLQVLSEYEQSCFPAGAVDAAAVKSLKAATVFDVGKTEFHGLASLRTA